MLIQLEELKLLNGWDVNLIYRFVEHLVNALLGVDDLLFDVRLVIFHFDLVIDFHFALEIGD